ncbi:MAG TPA: hypothetical protein VGJ54_03605 [Streptosporangiaceae bacterium]
MAGGGEVVEARRLGQVQAAQDVFVPGGQLAALGDGALGGAQGDQVQAFELVDFTDRRWIEMCCELGFNVSCMFAT